MPLLVFGCRNGVLCSKDNTPGTEEEESKDEISHSLGRVKRLFLMRDGCECGAAKLRY